jgi:hypothetical protein
MEEKGKKRRKKTSTAKGACCGCVWIRFQCQPTSDKQHD